MGNRFRLEQIQEFYITPTVTQHGLVPVWNNTTKKFDWISAGAGLIEALPFEFRDLTPGTSQTYELDLYAFYGYTVEGIVLEVDTGTLTDVHIKIGTTDITSLTTLTEDTSRDYTVATGANIVAVSNNVVLVTNTSYTGAPTLIRGSLKIKRT